MPAHFSLETIGEPSKGLVTFGDVYDNGNARAAGW